MNKKLKQTLIALASLGAVATAQQGKAEGEISYDAVTVMGRIENAVLSDDGKWFALKTTGAKIGDTEYAGWVGNTDNLNPLFSSDCLKDVASLAFFKNKLYVALNNKTNGLLRIDVGQDKMPHLKHADFVEFGFLRQETPSHQIEVQRIKRQAPYLYATTNNLYVIDNQNTSDGKSYTSISTLNENNQGFTNLLATSSYIDRKKIKDIISKNINNKDYLYVLSTNGFNQAELSFIDPTGETTDQTYRPWNNLLDGGLGFDYATTITIHGNNILSASVNAEHGYGYVIPFQTNEETGNLDGKLNPSGDPLVFYPSNTHKTSAIGSDGQNYYAHESDIEDPRKKRFVNGIPKALPNFLLDNIEPDYQSSPEHQGQGVFKIIVREGGKKAYGVAPDRIYQLKKGRDGQ